MSCHSKNRCVGLMALSSQARRSVTSPLKELNSKPLEGLVPNLFLADPLGREEKYCGLPNRLVMANYD